MDSSYPTWTDVSETRKKFCFADWVGLREEEEDKEKNGKGKRVEKQRATTERGL